MSENSKKRYISWMGCGISKNSFMDAIIKRYTKKLRLSFECPEGEHKKESSWSLKTKPILVDFADPNHGKIIAQEAGVDMIHVAWDAIVF